MPVYQVVRCAGDRCAKYQTQQEKKSGKWACVVCGLKQSLKRVYFQSAASKECRAAVMELNMNHGLAQESKQQMLANAKEQFGSALQQTNAHRPEHPAVSKWAEYMDGQDEMLASDNIHDDNDNDNHEKHQQATVSNLDPTAITTSALQLRKDMQTAMAAKKSLQSSQQLLKPQTSSARQTPYTKTRPESSKQKQSSTKCQESTARLSQALSELAKKKGQNDKNIGLLNSSAVGVLQQKPHLKTSDLLFESNSHSTETTAVSIKSISKWNEFESSSETESESDS